MQQQNRLVFGFTRSKPAKRLAKYVRGAENVIKLPSLSIEAVFLAFSQTQNYEDLYMKSAIHSLRLVTRLTYE